MVKKLKTAQDKGVPNKGFTPPFSLESFREDIVLVFVHYVRVGSWVSDWMESEQNHWAIPVSSDESPHDIANPELFASDLGFNYERIRKTSFAKYLIHLYNFAYFGNSDADCEDILDAGSGSDYTWITALISDVPESAMTCEFDSFGFEDAYLPAKHCLQVAETAQARVTLEGGEPFFYFQGDEGFLEEGFLTIRQMSLLAGMEEMSIRAAANPKRSNPLKTQKTEQGTRIKVQDAKEWLQSKGRYVPITRYWSEGDIDLTKSKFSYLSDLDYALRRRVQMIENKSNAALEDQLKSIGVVSVDDIGEFITKLDPDDPAKTESLATVAKLLELPPRLLYLRAKEAEAKQTLKDVERALRDLDQAS
ncbi:MAG: hypothetical protein LBR05_00530 [Azoarcus sp.]|nr:hypothetical protein [Azoarcus sp.]